MARGSRRSRSLVTIGDVARLAGVSSMTVSRVVNGEKNVRGSTRELVSAAVRELNYAPNLAARSLAKAEETRIGVIYSNPSAAFLSEFLVGVLDKTQGEGAQVAMVRCGPSQSEEVAAAKRLLAGGVAAVVLPPPLSESPVVRKALSEAGVPVAVVAAGLPPEGVGCVRIDDRQAAYDMSRKLLELGHRRIGLIGGDPNQTSSLERRLGLQAAVRDVAPETEILFAQGYFDYASGLTAAEELLSVERPPTAIFASNDDMAAAVVSVAHRRGLDVPGDLSVAGFDDTAVAVTLWPTLTTIRQPLRDMAARAVELLVARARSREPHAEAGWDEILPYTLVERQSTAPPRVRSA